MRATACRTDLPDTQPDPSAHAQPDRLGLASGHQPGPGSAPAGRIRLSRPQADGSRRVVDLSIAPEYRRRGVATEALNRCEGALSLSVTRTNLTAQRLYARPGFTLRGSDELDLFLHRP
ncbi:GNAT family N-acetyltransferase [Streptomyces sp. NPDC002187]|uniref:GNAT family N-acetyltransferase n=1 Tax=Streptomyces sp. NPDC002187 TaxID=3364637 RepID=UPI0036AE5F22